jgi:hypothetical protein
VAASITWPVSSLPILQGNFHKKPERLLQTFLNLKEHSSVLLTTAKHATTIQSVPTEGHLAVSDAAYPSIRSVLILQYSKN